MRKFYSRFLSAFLVIALVIGMVGVLSIDTTYAAAKKKKAAKKVTVKVISYSSDSVTLNWNKIKKSDKGYAVFRNGKAIAHLGKKATKFTDTNLSPSTSYTYQIKTFKVKKVKKKGKKIKKYSYKKKSNKVGVLTYPAPAQTPVVPYYNGPYINLEKDTVNVNVGNTAIIKAYNNDCPNSGYSINDPSKCIDIISRDNEFNSKGEYVEKVSIKGLKAGTAYIEFFVGESGEVKKTVRINVIDKRVTNRRYMYDYIASHGEAGSDENHYRILHNIDSHNSVEMWKWDNKLSFIFRYLTDNQNGYFVIMDLELQYTDSIEPSVGVVSSNYTFLAETLVDVASYNRNTDLIFTNVPEDLENGDQLCNKCLRAAMASFDLVFTQYYGIGLSDIGFDSY